MITRSPTLDRSRTVRARDASWPQQASLRLVQVDAQSWSIRLRAGPGAGRAPQTVGRVRRLLDTLAEQPGELVDLAHEPGPAQRLLAALLAALVAYDAAHTQVFRGAAVRTDASAEVVEGLPVLLAEAEVATTAWRQAVSETERRLPPISRMLGRVLREERLDLQLAVARWRLALAAWG